MLIKTKNGPDIEMTAFSKEAGVWQDESGQQVHLETYMLDGKPWLNVNGDPYIVLSAIVDDSGLPLDYIAIAGGK